MIALSRKPSIWANFFGRLAFGVVWAGAFFAFTWFIWTRRNAGHTPVFIWFVIGFFDLIAIGVVWDLVVRFWRALNGRVPVVEIDRKSLRYGDTAQLHVVEPHPESVKQFDVRLVAEHWVVTKDGTTTVKSYQACYDEELLRMNVSDETQVSRTMPVRIPETPPADDANWKIVVTTELRQGGLVQHPFPISIEKRAD